MEGKLWESLDIVRQREMLKGARTDGFGNHCALGFLDEAHGEMIERSIPGLRDAEVIANVAAEVFPGRDDPRFDTYNPYQVGNEVQAIPRVAAFNNHPDTTKADLELVFEKAAIKSDEILS